MKGYPKFLSTKADYEYVRTHFDKSYWQKDFQALLDTQYFWKPTKKLDSPDEGITDATHRVTEQGDDENIEFWQEELLFNEKCKMAVLGYTAEEVEAILA